MRGLTASVFVAILVCGCSGPGDQDSSGTDQLDLAATASCAASSTALAMNEVQSVGSHNSYKIAIPAAELAMIALSSPEAAEALDYGHIRLAEQLELGMRQLELDVFYDPVGGLYADPALPRVAAAAGQSTPFDATDMDQAGFKTMHVQDIDQRSHCALFTSCLHTVADWSKANPGHTPLLILVNAKQDEIELPGSVTPMAFTPNTFDALDAEIRSAFAPEHLLTPDDVRGGASTLREGIELNGWPSLEAAKGKVLFALDESPAVVNTYLRGKPSLEGHAMFVNSVSAEADHAAYFTINDPVGQQGEITSAVANGFLVRTRADADTWEARTNDTARREAALASGAQYISTDYYLPRAEFSDFQVRLPEGEITRCRP